MHTNTHTHTYKFTLFLSDTHTRLIWLRRLKWLQTHTFTLWQSLLEKTVRVYIIPACEKVACCLSICPAADRQVDKSDRQWKDTVSVCDSHCEGRAAPHSAVNRLNTPSRTQKHTHTHTHSRRQASQCTQESAVKYQGEALMHTQTHR